MLREVSAAETQMTKRSQPWEGLRGEHSIPRVGFVVCSGCVQEQREVWCDGLGRERAVWGQAGGQGWAELWASGKPWDGMT